MAIVIAQIYERVRTLRTQDPNLQSLFVIRDICGSNSGH